MALSSLFFVAIFLVASVSCYPSCEYPYECVLYTLCDDHGYIITDGAGSIDPRVRPQATCLHPEYPEGISICCLLPGTKPTPAPLETCYAPQECVNPNLCNAKGEIITDGSGGLIDIRVGQTKCLQPYNNEIGVCCSPTAPPILHECPHNSFCDGSGGCLGQVLNAAEQFVAYSTTGSWQQCALEYGNTGICCLLPVLTHCEHSVCLPGNQCQGTALNILNNFVTYGYSPTDFWRECLVNGYQGVCCQQPILNDCHSGSECIDKNYCLGEALNYYDAFVTYSATGSWRECYGTGFNGVCCIQPQRTVLDYCPLEAICVEYGSCDGNALNLDGIYDPYNIIGSWSQCNLGVGYTEPGVCCISKTKPYIAADKCGIRNYHVDQRIQTNYAKNEAAFGEFPWQGVIFTIELIDGKNQYIFKCGISLISNLHAITGAHCVDKIHSPSTIRLRFGEWQVNTFEEPLPYVDVHVSDIAIHPKYDSTAGNLHNDIALLTFTEPLPLQYHINTVCLPGTNAVYYEGQECFSTGWGKDSFEGQFQQILKKIHLPLVLRQSCQNYLRKTKVGRFFVLDPSFICAGGIANEDACYGDGGGPLVCKNPESGQYDLVGITAWGIGCGKANVPGVYVDVRKFHGWIDNIIIGGGSPGPGSGYGK